MPELDQVTGDDLATPMLVDGDGIRPWLLRCDEHHGHLVIDPGRDELRPTEERQDHEARDAVVEHELDRLLLAFGIAVGGAEHGGEAEPRDLPLHERRHLGEERVP